MARGVPAQRELSGQELIFCSEFFKTDDHAAAARVAYPGHKWPAKYGKKLLARPAVLKELARLRTKISAKLDVSAERTIAELAKIAFSDIADLFTVNADGSAELDLTRLTDRTKGALAEYSVDTYVEGRGQAAKTVKRHKAKMHDKLKALEILAKHFGIMSETVSHRHDHWHMLIDRLNEGRARTRQIDKENANDIPAQTYTLSRPYVAPKEPHDDK